MKNQIAESPLKSSMNRSLPPWLSALGMTAALAAALIAQFLLLRGVWLQASILYLLAGLTGVIALRGVRISTADEINAYAPIRRDLRGRWLAASLGFGVTAAFAAGWGASSPEGTTWLRLAEITWLAMFVCLLIASRGAIREVARRWLRGPWTPPAVLAIFSLLLGSWRLTQVPRAVHGDEGMVGLHARQILYGQVETIFSSAWYMLPQFFFTPPAASMAIFGDDLFGLRMSAVLLGTISALCLYATIRAWWGERVALFAVFLHLCGHWQLYLMRSGVQYGQAAFFYIATFALWRVCNRRRSPALCLLAGLTLGFALMSYQANHLLPFLWIASQGYLWLAGRITRRWLVLSTLLPLATASLTIAPLIAHDYMKTGIVDTFSSRASSVTVWQADNWAHLEHEYDAHDDPLRVWANQFYRAFLAPFVVLDRSGQFASSAPMLNVVAAALLGLAILLALARWRDPRWGVPLLWATSVFLVGGVLAVEAPFYPRFAGSLPMLSLLIAALLAHLLHSGYTLAEYLQEASLRAAWTVTAATLVLVSVSLGLHQFFHTYATLDAPRNVHYVQTRMGERISQFPEGMTVFVLYGLHIRFESGTVRFLANNARGRDVANLDDLLFWYEGTKPALVLIAPERIEMIGPLLRRFPHARPYIHLRSNGDLLFYEVVIYP